MLVKVVPKLGSTSQNLNKISPTYCLHLFRIFIYLLHFNSVNGIAVFNVITRSISNKIFKKFSFSKEIILVYKNVKRN